MTSSPDGHQPGAQLGRLSRRRAVGTFTTASIAAGLAARGSLSARAEGEPPSSQLDADGTTPFNRQLGASEPTTYAGGTFRMASVTEMPRLVGLSIHIVEIAPGAIREVHWHPNASEINYVLSGEGIAGVLSTSGDNAIFPIAPGAITFVPRGDAHYVQNNGAEPLVLLIGFSSAQPEHISVSQALPWVPSDVLNQTLGLPNGTLRGFPPRGDLGIVPLADPNSTPPDAAETPYSAPLSRLTTAQFGGGIVQALRVDVVPKLTDMTLLRLVVDGHAVREPHWHGNAAEFNYCASGSGQIGIVAPSGESWTFTVNAGDVAFIPNNWFHYIANIGDKPLELIAFFDAVAPNRIDLSTMANFFPPEVLAASLDTPPATFDDLPNNGTVVIAAPVEAGDPAIAPDATPST